MKDGLFYCALGMGMNQAAMVLAQGGEIPEERRRAFAETTTFLDDLASFYHAVFEQRGRTDAPKSGWKNYGLLIDMGVLPPVRRGSASECEAHVAKLRRFADTAAVMKSYDGRPNREAAAVCEEIAKTCEFWQVEANQHPSHDS
jgi:hypothetical protein